MWQGDNTIVAQKHCEPVEPAAARANQRVDNAKFWGGRTRQRAGNPRSGERGYSTIAVTKHQAVTLLLSNKSTCPSVNLFVSYLNQLDYSTLFVPQSRCKRAPAVLF